MLFFKLQRYEAYADRLRRHFQQLQLDRSFIQIENNEQQQHHSFKRPIEALSCVHNTQQQIFLTIKYYLHDQLLLIKRLLKCQI